MATLFFSYSHKDEALRDELEVHLAMLKREGLIEAWHDRRILAGDVLDSAISANLDSADVILLLCSPEFLNSEYCYGMEMKRAMERHERGECRVIAVILRPCEWQRTPFAKLIVTPTDGKPVSKWPDRDEAFQDVVRHIRAALPKTREPARPAAFTGRPASPSAVLPRSSNLRMRKEFTEASGGPATPSAVLPRSSNLRMRQEFTEADRDRFLDDSFHFISRFFEGSLAELQQRNEGIETRFIPSEARAFGAVIYRNGKAVARCGVRHGGARGFMSGITFSHDESAPTNSFNECLNVGVGEQSLFLKPMGMTMGRAGDGVNGGSQLTAEGAAEFLWSLLIEPLQR